MIVVRQYLMYRYTGRHGRGEYEGLEKLKRDLKSLALAYCMEACIPSTNYGASLHAV